jgi:hypothetical protein
MADPFASYRWDEADTWRLALMATDWESHGVLYARTAR